MFTQNFSNFLGFCVVCVFVCIRRVDIVAKCCLYTSVGYRKMASWFQSFKIYSPFYQNIYLIFAGTCTTHVVYVVFLGNLFISSKTFRLTHSTSLGLRIQREAWWWVIFLTNTLSTDRLVFSVAATATSQSLLSIRIIVFGNFYINLLFCCCSLRSAP